MKRIFKLLSVLVLLAIIGTAGLVGARVFISFDDFGHSLKKFSQILSIIEERYPDELDPQKAIYDSIQGMLRELDPHSYFLDEKSYQELNEEHQGKFYGLGIRISKRGEDKPLTVVAPIDNTPAKRAGIMAGDIITHIEDKDTMGMNVHDAVKMLKGPKGTSVNITVNRVGIEEALHFSIVRDEIPLESVSSAYMIRPSIGYLRITGFNQNTFKDFDAALQKLKAQGMKRCLLDLRDNTGGLLDQAVLVASKFIGSGKLIVYTKGRISNSNQEFYSEKNIEHERMPLIVLVNQGSASAAEIVSGAIQDHDRGLILGETTFGKGLVQKPYSMDRKTGLLLTTARYYTPSGRLIQRDYSSLEDYYYNEDSDVLEKEEMETKDIKYTDSGRVVYGGGGITPDVVVKQVTLSKLVSNLIRNNIFLQFAAKTVRRQPDIDRDFAVDEKLTSEFREFIKAKKVDHSDQEFQEDKSFIETYIKSYIFSVKYGSDEEAKVLNEEDPQILKGLELFPEAIKLAKASLKK
jgi:carboxyl-terminal processing protease